jgi:hypothetical protein
MNIRPVGAEMLRTDRRTEMTKPMVAFRNFPNAPKTFKKLFKKTIRCVITIKGIVSLLKTGTLTAPFH